MTRLPRTRHRRRRRFDSCAWRATWAHPGQVSCDPIKTQPFDDSPLDLRAGMPANRAKGYQVTIDDSSLSQAHLPSPGYYITAYLSIDGGLATHDDYIPLDQALLLQFDLTPNHSKIGGAAAHHS